MFENLFQHWIFWLITALGVLVFLFIAKERNFRDKVNFSVNGEKRWISLDAIWLDKNFYRLVGFIAGVGVVLMAIG